MMLRGTSERAGEQFHCPESALAAEPIAIETGTFLRGIPRYFGASILDVLISALPAAIRDWSRLEHALLDVIVHGREVLSRAE